MSFVARDPSIVSLSTGNNMGEGAGRNCFDVISPANRVRFPFFPQIGSSFILPYESLALLYVIEAINPWVDVMVYQNDGSDALISRHAHQRPYLLAVVFRRCYLCTRSIGRARCFRAWTQRTRPPCLGCVPFFASLVEEGHR